MKKNSPASKNIRRETRWEIIDDHDEAIEAEEAMNNLLRDGFNTSSKAFERELLKISKGPVSREQAKLRLRHEWEEKTGKTHQKKKEKTDKFKREILSQAFKRVALTLSDDQKFLMTSDLEKKTKKQDKVNFKFLTSKSKGWEAHKISKILDHIAKGLTKSEKEHLAPRFFERVRESLIGDVWTLSNLEEMILLDAFHHAVNKASRDEMKLASIKQKEAALLRAKKDLGHRRKSTKKDGEKLEQEYKAAKKSETHFMQKGRSVKHAKDKFAQENFEVANTARKQSAGEAKKIAKRALTKERNERAPTPLTADQRNHKMLKRVPRTRDRAAKYITTKRAINKTRH